MADGSTRQPRFIDAHCHLQDARLSHCLRTVVREAREVGLQGFSVNGCGESDWDKVQQLATDNADVAPNFGLHPWWVAGASLEWLQRLRQKLTDVPHAGLGECGLDYGHREGLAGHKAQLHAFRAQLRLAVELHRPVSVHCVRAVGAVAEEVRAIGGFPAGLVLHSWAGPAEATRQLAAVRGVHFSLSGHTLRLAPRRLAPMLAQVPLDRLLLETDSPDGRPPLSGDEAAGLCPVPAPSGALGSEPDSASEGSQAGDGTGHAQKARSASHHLGLRGHYQEANADDAGPSAVGERGPRSKAGQLNHPANIRVVLRSIAELMGRSEHEVAAAAYANAQRLFFRNPTGG